MKYRRKTTMIPADGEEQMRQEKKKEQRKN